MVKLVSIGLICLGLAQAQDTALSLAEAARRAEASGDSLNAFFLYGRAAAADPGNAALALQSRFLGNRLLQTASTTYGLDPARSPETIQANRIVTDELSVSEAIETDDALPPARLNPSTGRKPFDLRGTSRPVIEEVTRAFGIKTIFEPDFQSSPPMTFRTGELTREEAFHSVEAATNTFFVPINGDTVMVFPDTADKRNTFSPSIAIVIPIPARLTVQEAQELLSGVQQIMELKHMAVDANRKSIFIRDQEYKVRAALRMISDLSRYRSQVSIEVELISVANTSSLGIGLSLQNLISITNTFGPSTFAQLARVSTSWFGLGIANAQAFATLSRASTQSSLKTQLVSLDGQQSILTIGDRYPVITGQTGFGTNLVPIIQFQDLGLKMQVTPTVHAGGEVTLAIEADYQILGATQSNGIPIITQRKFAGTVRSKADEWTVIAGLAVSQTSKTTEGIFGLSELPGVGRLFRRDTTTDDSGQILIVLKPRIVSEPAWENPTRPYWMGTETKPPTFY